MSIELIFITLFFASILTYVFYNFYGRPQRKVQRSAPAEMKHDGDADIIIVGGGVVGATLAHSFGKQNKRVIVIEASMSEPDRIIGELLQPGGFNKLKMLGLEEATHNIDSAVCKGYCVFFNGERVHLPYPDLHGTGEQPTGRAFHYGKFVMNLRGIAQQQKTVQFIEGTVNKLVEADGVVKGVEYKKDDKTTSLRAPLTIVCNGSGSAFSKTLTPAKLTVVSHFVALELEGANEHLPMPGHGHVMITKQGPVLAYPTSSRTVRVLVDFAKTAMPDIGNGDMAKHINQVVIPQLPEQIRPFVADAVNSGKIKMAYNREMPSESTLKRGAVLIGDAFNCRHPLTGGGMTVAFNDCYLLQKMLANADYTNYDEMEQIMDEFYVERRKVASTINILANALYAIFAAEREDNPMVNDMKDAVFKYFKRGGNCATGPVGLLGGLIENPNVLLMHFFSVAVLYCSQNLFPIPTPMSLWNSLKLMKTATNIIGPYIVDENLLKYLFPPLVFQRSN